MTFIAILGYNKMLPILWSEHNLVLGLDLTEMEEFFGLEMNIPQ